MKCANLFCSLISLLICNFCTFVCDWLELVFDCFDIDVMHCVNEVSDVNNSWVN